MRIISLNANGIRSAATKGVFDWLRTQDADVVCLQETKAQDVPPRRSSLFLSRRDQQERL
jgi:exonuclease III